MLIEKFEELKEIIEVAIDRGDIKYIDLEVSLLDKINEIDEFIENNEIFYYVNTLKKMIEELEEELNEALSYN